MNRWMRTAATVLFLGAFALPMAHAEGPADPELKAHFEKKCAENPERCEKMKAHHAKMKARCEANPEECARRKAEFKKKREEMKALCESDPAACEAKKAEFRAKREERRKAREAAGE